MVRVKEFQEPQFQKKRRSFFIGNIKSFREIAYGMQSISHCQYRNINSHGQCHWTAEDTTTVVAEVTD